MECQINGNFSEPENHGFSLWFGDDFRDELMQDLLNPVFGVNYGTSKGAACTSRRAA